jgi:O-antigen/teichoic acid export membrane protein
MPATLKSLGNSPGNSSGSGLRQAARFAFNAACFTAPPILLNLISVPAMAYVIRGLGESNYGRWMTAVSLVNVTAFLTSLGLRPRFIRALAKDPAAAPALTAMQFGTRLLLATLSALTSLVVCLSLRYPAVVIACVAIGGVGVMINSVVTTCSDVLQAFEKLPSLGLSNFCSGLLLTAASVLAVRGGAGPAAVAGSYLVGPIVSSLFLLRFVRRQKLGYRPRFSPSRAWTLLWSSRHFGLQQMLVIGNSNAASLMLPRLIGPAEFGLFAGGAMILDRLAIIPDSIGTALYPMIAKLTATDPRAAARRAFAGLGFALVLCVCVAAVNTFLSHWIALILFPKHAADCERVIRITSWALPLIGTEYAMGYALLAAGREASQSRATLYGVLGGLALGIPVILHYGLNGAFVFLIARPAIQILFRLPDYFTTFVRGRPGVPLVSPGDARQAEDDRDGMTVGAAPPLEEPPHVLPATAVEPA